MRDDTTILLIVALAAAAWYYLFASKTSATAQAGKAGEWVAYNLINPLTVPPKAATTVARSYAQGCRAVLDNIPDPTGQEYVPNWSWRLTDGTKLGIPAGMTPKEFCDANATAPICLQGVC